MNILNAERSTLEEKGFNTSEAMQTDSLPFVGALNSVRSEFKSLTGDKTRTKEEKAFLMGKLKVKHVKALTEAANHADSKVNQRAKAFMDAQEKALAAPKVEKLFSVAVDQLINADDRDALVRSDPVYLQALNNMPAAMLGLSEDSKANLVSAGMKKHYPDLAKEKEQLSHDLKHVANLANKVEKITKEFDFNIDSEALGTRFEM